MNREERICEDGLTEPPIEFYGGRRGEPWGWMSNFSSHVLWLPHPFTGSAAFYRTGEHRYQAMKATTEGEHNWVQEAPTPTAAKQRGGAGGDITLREGWGDDYGDLCWYVMLEVVLGKARQHPEIHGGLAKTERRAIWEDSPTDNIWGIRYRQDYRGKNLLGRAWMEARTILSGAASARP